MRPVLILAGLSLAFVTLGIRAIGANSPTTDEPGHYRYGHRILRGVAERWDDSKMPISALNALPCYVAPRLGMGPGDADEFAGPCDWTLARLPTLLGGLVLGLAIAAWARRLFGWGGAIGSFALFAFDPNLLAHSTLITTDIFGALGILLALRAFSSWIEDPSSGRAAIAGSAIGLASISKYTAAYLPIIFLVSIALIRIFHAGKLPSLRAWLRGSVIAIGIALGIINAGFLFDDSFTSLRDQNFESPQFRESRKIPILASVPLPVPRPFVEGLDRVFHRERNGGGSGNLYFMGEIRSPGSEGFVTYFLVLGLIKSPLPTLAVLAFAGFLLVSRRNEIRNPQILTLVAAVLVFAIYFSLLFRAQIGLRHFLVVFPPLFVLAGIAGREFSASVAGRAGAVALIALTAASVIRHGDDPLSYFNELVDPTRTYLYAADSNVDWGQSKSRIESYLAANPDVITAPAKPFPGKILVGVNQLTGVVTRKRMEWLRESDLKPLSHVAYTHFLFVVSDEDAARMRARRGEPPLPPS